MTEKTTKPSKPAAKATTPPPAEQVAVDVVSLPEAAEPDSLTTEAKNIFASVAQAASRTLPVPVRPVAAFNDALSVNLRALASGLTVQTDIRLAPDGRRYIVIPPGFSAEVCTDTRLEDVVFEWRHIAPPSDGVLADEVTSPSGRVYVDVRPYSNTSATLFEGTPVVELY